ncbi:MAG: RIP metalloprotease RseP, partial [Gammaproteobacteria bacterium]|nr:RIP metalloprotease RseP [Gammaproteobacteria bacterium]
MSVLLSVLGFVVAIGLLVAVHEYGHFQVARWCGVKVLRFSVGFGKPLWTKIGKDGVEYQLAAIPLGGYVKMLDEREGEVPEHERHLAFNPQNVWTRIAVVAAGPLANFLFAIFAWWLVFILGVTATKPELGAVPANSPAAVAGLEAGDVVTQLNAESISSWEELRLKLIEEALTNDSVSLTVERDGTAKTVSIPLLGTPEQVDIAAGLQGWLPVLPAAIGNVLEDSAAKSAGLQVNDQIVSVNQRPVENWAGLVDEIKTKPGQMLRLEVLRDNVIQALVLVPENRVVKTVDGEQRQGFAGIGPLVTEEVRAQIRERQLLLKYGPVEALGLAVERTGSLSWLTLGMFGKMLTGGASFENIGGPVQIAAGAGATLALGIT